MPASPERWVRACTLSGPCSCSHAPGGSPWEGPRTCARPCFPKVPFSPPSPPFSHSSPLPGISLCTWCRRALSPPPAQHSRGTRGGAGLGLPGEVVLASAACPGSGRRSGLSLRFAPSYTPRCVQVENVHLGRGAAMETSNQNFPLGGCRSHPARGPGQGNTLEPTRLATRGPVPLTGQPPPGSS